MKKAKFKNVIFAAFLILTNLVITTAFANSTVEVSNQADSRVPVHPLLAAKAIDKQNNACSVDWCPTNIYVDYNLLEIGQTVRFDANKCLCVTYNPGLLSWSTIRIFQLQSAQKLSLISKIINNQVIYDYKITG